MAKNYLTKIILAFIVLFSFSSPFFKTIVAKESYSNLFIKITDANTAINNNEQDKAKKLIEEAKQLWLLQIADLKAKIGAN